MPILTFQDNRSLVERWRTDRSLAGRLDRLDQEQAQRFLYLWEVWSRPNQRIPERMGEHYRTWFFRAGRGSGKTRAAAETVRHMIDQAERIALISPTAADVRDVLIEGESGLLRVFPDDERPVYEPSKRRVTFANGARAYAYSGEEPERLRGPQHGFAVVDEPASIANGPDLMSNLMLGLRLGKAPWVMMTGTPKPVRWLRELAERDDTITTTGSTFDNAGFLAPTFIDDVLGRYDGTRLGRQELHAEWLDDVEGALWTEQLIDRNRLARFDIADPWRSLNNALAEQERPKVKPGRAWRIIVAVDPPASTAECGIVVACAPVQSRAGEDHCVILEDASISGTPERWGAQVVSAAKRWGAERVVVEANQGGDMVRATIHAVDPSVRVEPVHAKVSKQARAEPISALYERGLIHHAGFMPLLEAQMTQWVPGQEKSPDRMDAMVHAVTHLLPDRPSQVATVRSPTHRRIPA
jgi:phage terminase large subunit-like protein